MDWSEEIGRRIRAAREERGWSLSTLARHTSTLSKSRIGNYERGIRSPGVAEAHELARALGNRSAAYLMCMDEETALNPDENALLQKYRQSDERGRHAIQSLAEAESEYTVTRDGRARTQDSA